MRAYASNESTFCSKAPVGVGVALDHDHDEPVEFSCDAPTNPERISEDCARWSSSAGRS